MFLCSVVFPVWEVCDPSSRWQRRFLLLLPLPLLSEHVSHTDTRQQQEKQQQLHITFVCTYSLSSVCVDAGKLTPAQADQSGEGHAADRKWRTGSRGAGLWQEITSCCFEGEIRFRRIKHLEECAVCESVKSICTTWWFWIIVSFLMTLYSTYIYNSWKEIKEVFFPKCRLTIPLNNSANIQESWNRHKN